VKETPKLYNGSNPRASKPFHWRLYSSEYEGLIGDNTAYLVPEFVNHKEQQEILKEFYPCIFENELESWEPEGDWRENRDLKMFLPVVRSRIPQRGRRSIWRHANTKRRLPRRATWRWL